MSEFAGEDQLEGAMAVARMIPATYIVYSLSQLRPVRPKT